MANMKVISFAELSKQVHLINDLILSDMTYGTYVTICGACCLQATNTLRRMMLRSAELRGGAEVYAEEALSFSKHLLATKYWFARISWANKRRYTLALLNDVTSVWALSLLLKSLWNCRPKDAVLSISEEIVWSSYDQVPMDHNRTAQPVKTLAQVMTNDRRWFHSLEPEAQAMVLSELLTVAGGPVMWEVLRRAQHIYERYRTENLQNLLECIVVNDQPGKPTEKPSPSPMPAPPEKKKESQTQTAPKGSLGGTTNADAAFKMPTRDPRKDLDQSLAVWNATIKSIRDSQKLEELEMTFNDGTKRKIWKVNRVKPEAIETVDFVQLLPSSIGKHIISFLPRAQLTEYAKVNRYWAYLVDEFRAELSARLKLSGDLEKLQATMLKYDTSMEVLAQTGFPGAASSIGVSMAPSARIRILPSMRPSEKSAGAVSFRNFIDDKLKNTVKAQKPIRNLAEMTERLDRRGAADGNLWAWCENILKQSKKKQKEKLEEGVLRLGDMHFPCPLMKKTIDLPLSRPLRRDPSVSATRTKVKRTISNANIMSSTLKDQNVKRFSLWSRDFSSLYKVLKVASYQSPV